jgi:hypothetical protein
MRRPAPVKDHGKRPGEKEAAAYASGGASANGRAEASALRGAAKLLDGLDLDKQGTRTMLALWKRNPDAVERAVARAWKKHERGNVEDVGGLAIHLAQAECA